VLPSIHRSARRSAAAVVAALALLAAGLVPAQAAADATITGTVTLPAGLAFDSDTWMYVAAYQKVGARWSEVDRDQLWYDDQFTLDGLTAGASYLITLEHGTNALAAGFYAGPGAAVLPTSTGSPLVTAPAAGLTVGAVRGATITGTLVGAVDAVRASPYVDAKLVGGIDSGQGGWGTFDGAELTVAGLHPLASYMLEVADGWGLASFGDTEVGPGIADGYYAGVGTPLDPRKSAAVAVPAGTQDLAVQVETGATASGTFVRSASGVAGTFSSQLDLYDPATGERQDYTYGYTDAPVWPPTADDVDFSVGELALGTYKIGFNRESGPTMYVPSFYTGATTPARLTTLADAVPVTVAPGAAIDLGGLPMQTCASVAGTLSPSFVATGDHNTQVVLYNDAAGLSTRSWFGTGASYVVGGLVPGTYHVAVNTPDGVEHTLPDVTISACAATTGVELPDTLVAASPTISGTAAVGSVLTAKPGTWSPSGVTLTYAWKRGTTTVSTRSTYVPVAADVGKRLTLTVTGSKAGYTTTSRTATSPVVAAGQLRNTVRPTISGKAVVGRALTAKPGTWSPTATVSYRWQRNGVAISGATKSSYTATAADVGKRLSVKVTASRAGYSSLSATSGSSAKVARSTSKATTKLSATTARTKSKVKVTVSVVTPGVKKPTGVVKVKVGGKTYSATMRSTSKGKVTVTLPKLAKGRHSIKATFTPSGSTKSATTSATAKTVTLRIV